MTGKKPVRPNIQEIMPTGEEVQRELNTAKSMDDFFGKEGIFARLFANWGMNPMKPKGAIQATAATGVTRRNCAARMVK
jgi:hypothetical protein